MGPLKQEDRSIAGGFLAADPFGAGVASAGWRKFRDKMFPKFEDTTTPPGAPPAADDPYVRAARARMRAKVKRTGRRQTLLTSPGGVQSRAPVQRPSLMSGELLTLGKAGRGA